MAGSGGGTGLGSKTVIISIVVAVLIAGIATYIITGNYFTGALEEKDNTIKQLQTTLSEKEAQIESLNKQISSIGVTPSGATTTAVSEDVNCLLCHDSAQTKSFHLPQKIMKIDQLKGIRRRICIDCHGPEGPPNADEQMTKLSDITYDETVGTNGLFDFPNKVVHDIHKKKLDAGTLTCNFCHVKGDEFYIPQADTAAGQVLVCQNCMAHPEEGNYITIHVEMKGKKCTICHTGNVIDVHKEATSGLGKTS